MWFIRFSPFSFYFLLQNERVHNNVIVTGNRITIININKHDGGRYQCLIENGMENPPVEAINVVVNCKNLWYTFSLLR